MDDVELHDDDAGRALLSEHGGQGRCTKSRPILDVGAHAALGFGYEKFERRGGAHEL